MIPCRCHALNTLSGRAATDYVRHHLDVVREDRHGKQILTCPTSEVRFLLEPDPGPYGGDDQIRLRRDER